jgi:predicted class III extradiol MEMO1 family dioxygenase
MNSNDKRDNLNYFFRGKITAEVTDGNNEIITIAIKNVSKNYIIVAPSDFPHYQKCFLSERFSSYLARFVQSTRQVHSLSLESET